VRVLVGSVGYRNLSDHSFGILVIEALAERPWPSAVSIEDISYNPIAVVQRLHDEPADQPFELAILVSAAERPGRAQGSLSIYRWDNALPGPDDIQACVAEAVTGVISLDNTLVVTRYFNGLPPTVAVVEVEPKVHAFGAELSPEVELAFDRACAIVTRLATSPSDAASLPLTALGGGAAMASRPPGVQVQDVRARG
jgi:hydrogenase maturation protease